MGRIRTLKPEFPQSESMGRVSREARLCFILLWTIVDDSGRARASSRMLASLLFPYDDDAPALTEGWLDELEREQCIDRYEVDGNRYLQISKWLTHQKIDKPSQSRLPAFAESSRILAKSSEESTTDLGPRTKDRRTVDRGSSTKGPKDSPKGKPSSRGARGDPRHSPFRAILAEVWKATNSLEMPWDASEAKQLSSLLAANPTLDEDAFTELLRNRHDSRVNHSERPRQWLARLTDFGNGPLDQYGKPLREEGHDGKNDIRRSAAVQRQQASDDGIEQALRTLARDRNFDEPGALEFLESGDHQGDGHDMDGRVGRLGS